jgi:hypothetical protein
MVDTAGFVYNRWTTFGMPRQSATTTRTMWIRRDRSGAPTDTIVVPEPVSQPRSLTAELGNSRGSARVPFLAVPVSAFSPLGYFVTGMPDRYAFELRVPPDSARPPASGTRRFPQWKDGDPVISIRRPDARPFAVTAQERDDERAIIEERMRRVDPRWTWNGPEIPRTKPFFTKLVVGLDGRIWVPLITEVGPQVATFSSGAVGGGRAGSAGTGAPPSSTRPPAPPTKALYDVFEPSGAYVGQVEIPPRVMPVVHRGDFIWAVAFDADDVASVKRYRIVWR